MTVGLLITSVVLGLRHGVDWDHIAAIADLTTSSETRRRGFALSMLYAIGHALVVFALGATAIIAGASIPAGADRWMGRIVGATLIALGCWILVELIRKRRDFRLRSRWMLIINGTFAGIRRVRRARSVRSGRSHRHIVVDHQHDHDHDVDLVAGTDAHLTASAHDHAHLTEATMASPVEQPTAAAVGGPAAQPEPGPLLADASDETGAPPSWRHVHRHRHQLALPDEPSARYANGSAAGIGMLHGIGVESPTQIALFVASTSVAGASVGLLLLAGWIVGLILANAALALLAGFGLLHAERNFGIYATLAVAVGVISIAMGTIFALDLDALPAINL